MKKIFLLDDDQDLVDVMCLIAAKEGASCTAASAFEEAVQQRDKILECELAIVDINLGSGRKSGIDFYHWLKSQGYKGRVVFLTAHGGPHPLVKEASSVLNALVLSKPIEFRQLVDLFHQEAA